MSGLLQKLLVATLLATGATGAFASVTDLIGTYTARDKNGVRDILKIERQGDTYILFDKSQDGSWRKAKEPLVPVTKEQFDKIIKPPTSVAFDGLATKGMAIFKVPQGWGQGKFKTESGYFMVFGLGPIELQKR